MHSPVNVFGRSSDVGGIAYRILGALPEATVESATDGAGVTAVLPSGAAMRVVLSTSHLAGEAGERQRRGMASWLSSSPLAGAGLGDAIAMIDDLRVSVAFLVDGDATPEDGDALVALAVDVAGWADGFVLAMGDGVLLGPDGSLWAEPTEAGQAPDEPEDPEATGDDEIDDPFVSEARRMLREGITEGAVIDSELLPEAAPDDPPTPERIRARAIVVAAVAARSLNEAEGTDLAVARTALLDWVEATGAADELEPWEAKLLAAEPGAIEQRDLLNGSWMTEGAAVLAWALGTIDLPGPDRVADPGDVFSSLGLADPSLTDAALDVATPRGPGEVELLRRRLLTIHWRLREHGLRPGPMDLAANAERATWGPLSIAGIELADGDLALGGVPIADADPEMVGMASSIAVERHRAVNWLVAGGSWADTDVST